MPYKALKGKPSGAEGDIWFSWRFNLKRGCEAAVEAAKRRVSGFALSKGKPSGAEGDIWFSWRFNLKRGCEAAVEAAKRRVSGFALPKGKPRKRGKTIEHHCSGR